MNGSFNDSPLQIIAAQLATVRANECKKSFWQRAISRINREFLQKGTRDKLRFAKFAVRESITRLRARLRPPKSVKVHVDVPENRVMVVAKCNGGMGDLIIYSAFLDRFYREYGGPLIHVLVHPLRIDEARFVFNQAPAIALVTDVADLQHDSTPYDVIMTLGDFPAYDYIRDERIGRIAPDMLDKLKAAIQIQKPYRGFIDAQPLFDGMFATHASQLGISRLDLLGWLGNVRFAQHDQLYNCPEPDGYRRFEALGLADRPYITIHNGWDNVAHRNTTNATKGWPPAHYERFVAQFKQRFPQVSVVQLGAKTSRPIAGTDISLLDDTTLPEAAWILKHSLLHVDGDSGLVHLARALHTKSVVLFGPTNHEFFRYAQNDTCFSSKCGNCWWSTNDWMRSCPRGLAEPECMKSIEPDEVFRKAEQHLRSLPSMQVETDDFVKTFSSLETEPADRRVAVVEGEGLPASNLAAGVCNTAAFSFHKPNARADREAPHYGSIYNIPAENGTFDIVISPLMTEQTRYPLAALKELLRIVRVNGRLLITYRFQGESDRWTQALESLGIDPGDVTSTTGGIVLRKTNHGQLFAERNSRASQRIVV